MYCLSRLGSLRDSECFQKFQEQLRLSLSHARCLEGGAPEAEQTTDFALIVQEHAEVSWQDGEIGPKCALLSLSQGLGLSILLKC